MGRFTLNIMASFAEFERDMIAELPLVSDWSNYGRWQEKGSLTATQRANGIWKKILADFEAPTMDISVYDELQAFVERRTSEGGAAPDS